MPEAKFQPSRMYGVTHDAATGEAIVKVPRSVKVGIGLPQGKAIAVFIDASGRWTIVTGAGKEKQFHPFPSKAEARAAYDKMVKQVADRPYPEKLPFFIFTRPGPSGGFEPDWDTIEAHGPMPTAVDIVFTSEQPFKASYQMWTAAEKQCEGDGLNALRTLSLARSDAEKVLAAEARAAHQRFFPIINGCRERGCEFAAGDSPRCKPHGELRFQLVSSPSIGSVATFDTTSFESVVRLHSSIHDLRGTEGRRIAGVPLKLKLEPFRVRHAGKASTAYAVRVELRGTDITEMRKALAAAAERFRRAGIIQAEADLDLPQLPPAVVEAEAPEEFVTEAEQVGEAERASALHAEFYAGAGDNGGNGDDFANPADIAPVAPPMPQRKSQSGGTPPPVPAVPVVAPQPERCPDCGNDGHGFKLERITCSCPVCGGGSLAVVCHSCGITRHGVPNGRPPAATADPEIDALFPPGLQATCGALEAPESGKPESGKGRKKQ